jgi:hypothetical protein
LLTSRIQFPSAFATEPFCGATVGERKDVQTFYCHLHTSVIVLLLLLVNAVSAPDDVVRRTAVVFLT